MFCAQSTLLTLVTLTDRKSYLISSKLPMDNDKRTLTTITTLIGNIQPDCLLGPLVNSILRIQISNSLGRVRCIIVLIYLPRILPYHGIPAKDSNPGPHDPEPNVMTTRTTTFIF